MYLEEEVKQTHPKCSFVHTTFPWSQMTVFGRVPDCSVDEEEPDDIDKQGKREQSNNIKLLFLQN